MARYRWHPERGVIPIEEWLELMGGEPERSRLQIVPDLQPYRNVIDGKPVTSRSAHREFLRRHGVEEVGNERPRPPARPQPDREAIRRDIARAIERHS